MNRQIGCWLAAPDIVFIEIAANLGYGTLVIDVEHGTFDLKDLDKLIPFARRLGFEVLVKVEGPRAEPIQQALDFGASGVVVPHIGDARHAEKVCSSAKYPLMGTRSYAGARTVQYGAPSLSYFDEDNASTKCFAMVETAESFADIDRIVGLPMVDGIFVGPSDLSLTRGRGNYRFGDADRDDMCRIAVACKSANKPWIMPAWRTDEQLFAKENGAEAIIISEQQSAMYIGLEDKKGRFVQACS